MSQAAEYNEAVKQATLLGIMLTSSSFDVTNDFRDEHEQSDKYIDQTIVGSPDFDAEEGLLIGMVRCRVWMISAAQREELKDAQPDEVFASSFFAVEAIYDVIFKVSGEHETSTLEAFFEKMAPFAVWPYFRSHLATVSAEAALNVPILPIKKLFHPVKAAGGYREPDVDPADPA